MLKRVLAVLRPSPAPDVPTAGAPGPDPAPSPTSDVCPRCGGKVLRVRRRLLDRLRSRFVEPVRRYACRDIQCGWQGLRRVPDNANSTAPQPPGPPKAAAADHPSDQDANPKA